MSMGFGLTIGPLITILLQHVLEFDYMQTFYSLACLIFIFGNSFVLLIPKSIDDSSLYDSRFGSEDELQVINVPYSHFLRNTRGIMALMAYFTTASVIVFYDPILSTRVVALGIDDSHAGIAFSIMTFMFAVSASLMGCLAEKIDRRIVIGTCFVLISVSIFLTGSSSLTVTLVGLGVNGIFIGGIFSPVIPEVINSMQEVFVQGPNLD